MADLNASMDRLMSGTVLNRKRKEGLKVRFGNVYLWPLCSNDETLRQITDLTDTFRSLNEPDISRQRHNSIYTKKLNHSG
jgi:hypothetical protein